MPSVLIVDDSKVDQRLAGRLLEGRGDLTVQYADDGETALSLMRERTPDIVVTDLQMAKVDGLELVRTIRAEHPGVPVVLMTGIGSEEVAAEALRQGAASYVPKKLLARDLAVTVERILTASDIKQEHTAVISCYRRLESHFEMGNDSSIAHPLVQHLRRELGRLQWCDATDLMRIGVALDEAITNAIHHGNLEGDSTLRDNSEQDYLDVLEHRRGQEPYASRRVRLSATVTPTEARFVIADEGPGFDASTLPDPTDPENMERLSGRGLLLIRAFMDEVEHNETGNEIIMVKRRDEPESPASSEAHAFQCLGVGSGV